MGELRCTLRQAQDGVAVPLDESTTIIVVPAVAQVTLKGRALDTGRTFLLPRALSALNEVWAFATRMRAKHAIVVGHVDPAETVPEPLSKVRAKLAAAWLAGEVQPWVDQYETNVAEAQRWGAREDRYLLSVALGGVASPPPKAGEKGDPQVRAFQTLVGVEVDGIAGPVTRGKLVEKYFALSRTALLDGEKPPVNGITLLEIQVASHGAGAHFTFDQVARAKQPSPEAEPPAESTEAIDSTEASEPTESQARLDFMFFFADSAPDPAPGAADGPEFLEWVKQTELQRVAAVNSSGSENAIFVELWDKAGFTRHKGAKYQLTGPESLAGVTDSEGRIEHDDVLPGDYTLTLTLEFFSGADKITDEYKRAVVVHGSDIPEVCRVGAVPRCELVRIKGLLFDTSKAFLVPEAVESLRQIRAVYERHNGDELLVVGHTDTVGKPSFNDVLSLERAKATLAYLQDDVETWLSFYDTSVQEERRWGSAEDARMQTLVNNPGLTRAELIAAYMQLDGVELDSSEFQLNAIIHGCGENFPLDDSGEELQTNPADNKADVLDRRVELFFFDAEFGIVPKPAGENSKKGSKQYPAWRKLAKVVSDAAVKPGSQEVRRLLIGSAHFDTDSSLFLPSEVTSGGKEIDAPREFSNDAGWEQVKSNSPRYVEAAKEGDFVPPEAGASETGGASEGEGGGLEVILTALRFSEQNPGFALVVAGHADRVGGEAHNDELSTARAECVVACLAGDRAGYVQAAKKHHQPSATGSLLAFAARTQGFDCSPDEPAQPSKLDIERFQRAYNQKFGKSIGADGVVGDETRGALYDVLEAELVRTAGDAAALAELRQKLTFVDSKRKTLACGERFPIENPEQDDAASQVNRRVELLFFAPNARPDLSQDDAAEQIYTSGTFQIAAVTPDAEQSADAGPTKAANDETDELVVTDAPAPDSGVGGMDGELTSEMDKLQESIDPSDEYAFLDPFDRSFPAFGGQQPGDFPLPDDGTAVA